MEQLRWPDGFRCPKCGGAKAWRRRTGLFECAACGRLTSVTAGTMFQDTRTPLGQQAVAVEPAPYASLVKHVRSEKRRRRRHKI